MKPRRSMREAVLSFLGGSKKDLSIDASQRVLEDKNSRSSKTYPTCSERGRSCLNDLVTSLPSRQRIEEWKRKTSLEFDPEIEEGIKRTLSASSKRSQEIRQLNRYPLCRRRSSTYFSDTMSSRSYELAPWDSVSQASFCDEGSYHSGSYNMYVNEDDNGDEMFQTSTNRNQGFIEATVPNRNPQKSSPSKLKRCNSDSNIGRDVSLDKKKLSRQATSSVNSQSNRTLPRSRSQPSNAGAKLLSCMDTLERLSKKLKSVSIVSSQVEELTSQKRSTSTDLQKENKIQGRPKKHQGGPVEWRIGEEKLKKSNVSKNRRKSYESSSTDSGMISNRMENNEGNYFVYPRNADPPTLKTKNNSFPHPRERLSHPWSVSSSSGYSSGSGGYKRPPQVAPINYYPLPSASGQSGCDQIYSGFDPSYLGNGEDQCPLYESEDPYLYGSYGYPSSSVYDEDLNQQNGWFYLPQPAHPQPVAHVPPHASHTAEVSAPPTQPYYYVPRGGPEAMGLQSWHGTYPGVFPHSATMEATCSRNRASCVTSSNTNLTSLGSTERRRNLTGNSPKRKTVRFSRTVKERAGSGQSDSEDSTSLIKGEDNRPSSLKGALSFSSGGQSKTSEHTIYEFPTGHIESSCMCSDCILARKSSQLNPAANYFYY